MEIAIISPSDMRANRLVDDNLDEQILLDCIDDAQEIQLQSRLGSSLYNRIITEVKSGTISDDVNTLITEKITKTLLYYSIWYLAEAKLSRITNSGVVKDDKTGSVALELAEARSFLDSVKNKYVHYENLLTLYLKAHTEEFPTYLEEVEGEESADLANVTRTVFDYRNRK